MRELVANLNDAWERQNGSRAACMFIPGVPAPQGSKKAFTVKNKVTGKYRAVVTDDSKKSRPWQDAVAYHAAQERTERGGPITTPVRLACVFYFERPRSHFRTDGVTLAKGRADEHAQEPDLSKLVRALEDGLVAGGLLADDKLIFCYALVEKKWADAQHPPGASVALLPVRPD